MSGYKRVLLKLSGEVFGGGRVGVDPDVVQKIAREIAAVQRAGVEVAIVTGGGNFFRGAELQQRGMARLYMRVRSSRELRHRPGPFPLCQRLRASFGSRAVLSRSRSCITLHAVGSVAGPAPECLMHEAWPRQNTTHLKRGGLTLPMTKTVALPVSPPMIASPAAISPMPRARHPPAAARSGHSARARSAACAPSRRWRSAVCARPVRRRARETTRRARCRAGSAARARQAG